MRTENQFVRNLINATCNATAQKNFLGFGIGSSQERDHYVGASLLFICQEESEDEDQLLEQFRNAIIEADKRFPWHDKTARAEWKPRSLGFVNMGEVVIHNWTGPRQHIWFNLEPKPTYLIKGQVQAYRKYLDQLARTLFDMGLPGVREIHAIQRVSTTTKIKP